LDFAFAAVGTLIDTSIHVVDSIQAHAAARLREHPDARPEDLRLKLAFAEDSLAAAADAERHRRSLLSSQLLPIGFSVVTGLVLGIGFGHWQGAAINTAAAIVVNELRVLTQPTSTIEALRQYQHEPNVLVEKRKSAAAWAITVTALGCKVQGQF
jgi:hypothetical protein